MIERQRRLAHIKFFGELYNYSILNKDHVLNMLGMLLSFGHKENADLRDECQADPKDDTFRITLIVTLLDSVAEYLMSKKNRAFVEKYLIEFQRYILSKTYLPMLLEFMVLDLFDKLSPNLKRFKTYEEANEAYKKLKKVVFCIISKSILMD